MKKLPLALVDPILGEGGSSFKIFLVGPGRFEHPTNRFLLFAWTMSLSL